MSQDRPVAHSGEGTRPTTSGGVDNIGAGEKFTGRKTAAGEDIGGPAPRERMQDKRSDVEANEHDDATSFNLHEDLSSVPNTERVPTPEEMPANAPKGRSKREG